MITKNNFILCAFKLTEKNIDKLVTYILDIHLASG